MLNVTGLTKLTLGEEQASGFRPEAMSAWKHVCGQSSRMLVPICVSVPHRSPWRSQGWTLIHKALPGSVLHILPVTPKAASPLQHSTDTGLWSILRPPCPPPEVRRPPGTQQPPPHRLRVYFYHCSHSPQSQGHTREWNWGKRAWLAPESPSNLHRAQHWAEGHPLPVTCCGWPSNLRLNPVWRKTPFLTLWELYLGKPGEIGLPDFWKRLCPSLPVGERERQRRGPLHSPLLRHKFVTISCLVRLDSATMGSQGNVALQGILRTHSRA